MILRLSKFYETARAEKRRLPAEHDAGSDLAVRKRRAVYRNVPPFLSESERPSGPQKTGRLFLLSNETYLSAVTSNRVRSCTLTSFLPGCILKQRNRRKCAPSGTCVANELRGRGLFKRRIQLLEEVRREARDLRARLVELGGHL